MPHHPLVLLTLGGYYFVKSKDKLLPSIEKLQKLQKLEILNPAFQADDEIGRDHQKEQYRVKKINGFPSYLVTSKVFLTS